MSLKTIRRFRRVVQLLALALFVFLFIISDFLNPVGGLATLFYRLDPLVALTAILAGRVFIAGLALSLITLALTVVFGRVWCGWICPLGTVLDLFGFRQIRKKGKFILPPEWLRMVKYLLLLYLISSAIFANQTFLFLDPITILTRTLAVSIWPALGAGTAAVESFLYQFESLWAPLDVVHKAVIYPLFKDSSPVYVLAVPTLVFFIMILVLNLWAERFWCRYLCPLGGLLGLVSRFALFKRQADKNCTGCGLCSRHCPTGTIDPARNYTSDPAECTVCFDCVESCPKDASKFIWQLPGLRKTHPNPVGKQTYDPGRREVLGAFSAAVVWTALAGAEPVRKRQPAVLIRPPGAESRTFESLCIRCNECVRICPTHGLQPSVLEGGWQNILTPQLIPRLGYCNYSCVACGEVCPSGAIPRLTLEEKRKATIGLARVDRSRCLPWAYNIECIVCEEACPVADKAIRLEIADVINKDGEQVAIQRPTVVRELCIGCGMCEYQCPMGGEAAIKVLTYTEAGSSSN